MGSEPEPTAGWIAWEHEVGAGDDLEEGVEGAELVVGAGGQECHGDGSLSEADMTGRNEEIPEGTFRLCGPSEEGREVTSEIRLGVRAGDAHGIERGLVVRRVLDELAGELGVRESRFGRRGWPQGQELSLLLDSPLCQRSCPVRSPRDEAAGSTESGSD